MYEYRVLIFSDPFHPRPRLIFCFLFPSPLHFPLPPFTALHELHKHTNQSPLYFFHPCVKGSDLQLTGSRLPRLSCRDFSVVTGATVGWSAPQITPPSVSCLPPAAPAHPSRAVILTRGSLTCWRSVVPTVEGLSSFFPSFFFLLFLFGDQWSCQTQTIK